MMFIADCPSHPSSAAGFSVLFFRALFGSVKKKEELNENKGPQPDDEKNQMKKKKRNTYTPGKMCVTGRRTIQRALHLQQQEKTDSAKSAAVKKKKKNIAFYHVGAAR